MKKRMIRVFLVLAMLAALTGCGGSREQNSPGPAITARTAQPGEAGDPVREDAPGTAEEDAPSKEAEATDPVLPAEPAGTGDPAAEETTTQEVKEKMLRMMIGDTPVAVEWENNESVEALKALCENAPLVIQMSMYGGFEQVGPIGAGLPSEDVQTTTSAGDIVLYSSSQIVVFYGSNSWAYTRLGHITDQDASGMAALLGSGDVTVTLRMEETE